MFLQQLWSPQRLGATDHLLMMPGDWLFVRTASAGPTADGQMKTLERGQGYFREEMELFSYFTSVQAAHHQNPG